MNELSKSIVKLLIGIVWKINQIKNPEIKTWSIIFANIQIINEFFGYDSSTSFKWQLGYGCDSDKNITKGNLFNFQTGAKHFVEQLLSTVNVPNENFSIGIIIQSILTKPSYMLLMILKPCNCRRSGDK